MSYRLGELHFPEFSFLHVSTYKPQRDSSARFGGHKRNSSHFVVHTHPGSADALYRPNAAAGCATAPTVPGSFYCFPDSWDKRVNQR